MPLKLRVFVCLTALLAVPALAGRHVNDVQHTAFVNVDEEGTEAAAATATLHAPTAPEPPPTIDFNVDRPFLFYLRHVSTGLMLFMGRVVNPSRV